MNDALFDVRVWVRSNPPRDEAFFDLTHLSARSETEAVVYALELSHECFGLPYRQLHARVRRITHVIDC